MRWIGPLVVAASVGCGGGGQQGIEGATCYPNGTCHAGLVCRQNICVRPGSDAALPQDGGAQPGDGKVATDGAPASDHVLPVDAKPTPDKIPAKCSTNADCDDGHDCTNDFCGAGGTCSNFIKGGWCLIGNTCFADKAANPANSCERCDAVLSPEAWKVVPDNTPCDDKQPCTKSDLCKAGTCTGVKYDCEDMLTCTIDTCDGQGGCSSKVTPGYCAIGGKCYKNGATKLAGLFPDACFVCDASLDPTAWTVAFNLGCYLGVGCTNIGKSCSPINNNATCIETDPNKGYCALGCNMFAPCPKTQGGYHSQCDGLLGLAGVCRYYCSIGGKSYPCPPSTTCGSDGLCHAK